MARRVAPVAAGLVSLVWMVACSSTPDDRLRGELASSPAPAAEGTQGAGPGGATDPARGGAPRGFLGVGQPPGVSLTVAGPERAAVWSRPDRCPKVPGTSTREEEFWVVDGPARAYKDAAGRVRLYSPHHLTYPMVGDDASFQAGGKMEPDCGTVAYRSNYVNDPSAHDDASWLWSPYRLPDGSFVSLVHNEYHGSAHGPGNPFCPSGDYGKCWRNSLTLATSADGVTFTRAGAGDAAVVAKSHYPYIPDNAHAGYFEPSNILQSPQDGAFYALTRVVGGYDAASVPPGVRQQKNGICLLRTTAPKDPKAWTVYDGKDAAGAPRWVPAGGGAACEPVIHRADYAGADALGSVHWSTYLNAFVVLTMSDDGANQGFFVRTSLDLIGWSAPRRIFDVPLPWGANASTPGKVLYAYPSFLNAAAPPNYDTLGQRAELLFVRVYVNANGPGLLPQRELMRVPVDFTTTDQPPGLPVGGFGCYRNGPGGFFDNGEGARCSLLDVDLPGVCGVAPSGFAQLPPRDHGPRTTNQQGYGGRCAGGNMKVLAGRQPQGCYRSTDAGFYANGQGSYCALLDVDLPSICGTSNFFALEERWEHGTDTRQQGNGGRCLGNTPPPPPVTTVQAQGCYRVGPAGFYANGQGRFCALLDVDLPSVCGVAPTAFTALAERSAHGTDVGDGPCRSHAAPGCYRIGPAGFYAQAGRYCALLDVDMPRFCGTTDFYGLSARGNHVDDVPWYGDGGNRCR